MVNEEEGGETIPSLDNMSLAEIDHELMKLRLLLKYEGDRQSINEIKHRVVKALFGLANVIREL